MLLRGELYQAHPNGQCEPQTNQRNSVRAIRQSVTNLQDEYNYFRFALQHDTVTAAVTSQLCSLLKCH